MNEMELIRHLFRRSRERTLGLLAKIEAEPDPKAVLGWRPGPNRAHIAWQLMHIAITEEIIATERLVPGGKPAWPDQLARFRGGSKPDDNIPTVQQMRDVLAQSREHLEATMQKVAGSLDEVPPPLKERNLTVRDALALYLWHEGHHQGQAHLTLNLYKAR